MRRESTETFSHQPRSPVESLFHSRPHLLQIKFARLLYLGIISVVSLGIFLPNVAAVHLLFSEGRSLHCFRVNQPSGTAVTMSWFISEKMTQNSKDGFRVFSKVGYSGNEKSEASSSRNGKKSAEKEDKDILSSQELDKAHGVFRFATVNDKPHSLCLESPFLDKASGVEIEIEYGLSEDYYTELYRKSNVEPLEAHLMKLNSKMSEVLSEADYMKDKEVMFHQQCERTNSASQIWPILQVSILIVTGYMQVRSLKNFFKSKKLI